MVFKLIVGTLFHLHRLCSPSILTQQVKQLPFIFYSISLRQLHKFFYGRIFTAYGYGQYKNNFWPSLVNAANDGRDFQMTDGSQVMDFLTVEKVASHFVRALHRTDLKKSQPFVVNVASGQPCSLWSLHSQNGDA